MIAVLIHAHKNAAQLAMLIHALQHPEIKIFVHIDKKSKLVLTNGGVMMIKKPLSVEWGSFSQVEALLHSLKQIKESGVAFDFVHFISGQDFPIKPIKNFVDFLNSNHGKSFVHYKKVETEWPDAKKRYQRFYYTQYKIINRLIKPFSKFASLFYKRKSPVEIFAGSQWVTLSSETVNLVLEKGNKRTPLYHFFKCCDVSDEMFIQTILLNSSLKDICINNNLRFIKWRAESDSPDVLTVSDFEEIKKSPAFFARKFDADKDAAILEKISAQLL